MQEREPELEDLSKFLIGFNKETDRGAVLLAASIIDEWLSEILINFLKENSISKELVLGFNAPLGTFSARTKMAFSLSLIEKREYDEINIIRKIRNQFGHNWQELNFDSEIIKKECDKLNWFGPYDLPDESFTNRNKFNFVIVALLGDLLWRKRLVKKERIVEKTWEYKQRKY
jgi:hypothetical protein